MLLFLLPWVTVSCAEQELVSLSGMDLATGSINVTNPMTGETVTPARSNDRDLPVLIAALLIVMTLVVGFVVRRALAMNLSLAPTRYRTSTASRLASSALCVVTKRS